MARRWSGRARGLSPAQIIAASFLGAIAVGTALLSLPASHAGARVGVLDAFFTATSAVCVTGLVTVDTASGFSRFGQAVILALFQLGGFGVLTLGSLLTIATGRRMGFQERVRLQSQVSALDVGSIASLLNGIVIVVVAVELVGTVLLFLRFSRIGDLSQGLFASMFHAVSAFNNAGFALYPDSLSRFVTDPVISFTVIGLIIVGGLGFMVIVELPAFARHGARHRLSLHSRMALAITAFLLATGFIGVLLLEWANPATLGDLDLRGKLLASLFQGTTPRTAGFNTLDYSEMSTSTQMFTILLMFIGGNPGSTAGGIKTVTFLVLVMSVWSVIRQRNELTIFGRRIGAPTVVRAGAIAFAGVMLCGAAATLLTITEDAPLMPILFETVSAFGTVGLSLGITSSLSPVGKLVIIVLMYVGRIGFLTFALALVTRHPLRAVRYPSEEVVIG